IIQKMTRKIYDVRRSNESPQKKGSDDWILQRSGVRQLPAKPMTPQNKIPDWVVGTNQIDLTPKPVWNYSTNPYPRQAKAKEPNRQEEETESQWMQGKVPPRVVGEEKVVNAQTMVKNGQVQQHRSKGMPVAKRDGGKSGRETPIQPMEVEKKAENKTGLPDRLKEG
ncbi:hypothetical protein, partial [Moorena sp. SIO4A1]|uniref:hypothetical protein n=1 Tax=Moorena sp. SIO4A1 TaxID=2607835 RepID=UPI0025FBA24A